MKDKLYIEAFGFVATEENTEFTKYYEIEIGTGVIDILYSTEKDADSPVGYISICSNGTATCALFDKNYNKNIFNDFFKITGEKIDMNSDYYFCRNLNKSKWENVKKYISDNNISLTLSEEFNIDKEENEKKLAKDKIKYYSLIRR